MTDQINKYLSEPAYAQLAAILRRQIAAGVYPPGERIPSESTISRQNGISIMTVRQAISLLLDQGLVERVQGSGTFVKPLTLTESRFDLDSIREIFRVPERTRVKVLRINLERADGKAAEILHLPRGERIIVIRRLLLHDDLPVMFHEGRIRCDPSRPLVEAELSLGPLSELFNGQAGSAAKKGELTAIPTVLGEDEANLLGHPAGTPVIRLEYVVYDFDDSPFGWGWFTAAPGTLTLKAKLGLWDES
jgi:DNA-binding GntR family transcriptional regulator